MEEVAEEEAGQDYVREVRVDSCSVRAGLGFGLADADVWTMSLVADGSCPADVADALLEVVAVCCYCR